jgi:O-antigen/teichoic acid export membrane protein
MLQAIRYKIGGYLKRDNELSQKILKNILLSFGVKLGSILIGLILVPLTISYINPVQYGVWLTISSIVTWMSFFDIGLGNGLRNKLAASSSVNNYDDAKTYISTTYATLAIISIILFVAFIIINPLINWPELLNIPASSAENIQLVISIVFGSFCIQFVVQLINTILTATHEPAKASMIAFIGQLVLLITVFILKSTVTGSLKTLVIALTGIPILILIISSIFLFKTRLKHISPSFSHINFRYAKELLNIGGAFFVIQIGALVFFQTDNIIISRVIGPEAVTQFNVCYKLFSVASMVFVIIITPYWSAFTAAYTNGNYDWIKKNIAVMRKLWLFLSLSIIVLYFAAPLLYKVWLGDKVVPNAILSLSVAVYFIANMWQSIHLYFLNGIGKIKLQLILVILSAFLNIPLAFFLGKKFGIPGIVSANTVVFLVMNIFFTIQTQKIVNKTAKGIWNR